MDTVDFAGIKVDNLTIAEALERVAEFLTLRTPHLIVTVNPELIVAAQKDLELKNVICFNHITNAVESIKNMCNYYKL